MNTYKIATLIPATLVFLLTAFKKESENTQTFEAKSVATISRGIFTEPVRVSVANATAIKGDKGQRPVKAMVYLSQAITEAVIVKYSTEDRSAKAGVDYVATKGSVTFNPGEVAKWITVPIIGEVAADPDEDALVNQVSDFIIKVTESIGVIRDAAVGYITIIQNIAQDPSILGAAGGDFAVYEVKISYTGYATLADTAEICGADKAGFVELSGLLYGVEEVDPYDDITYTGNLEMTINIDICSIARELGSDEDRHCRMTVNGSGKVYVELDIYFADTTTRNSRGGYMKIEDTSGRFIRTIDGTCGEQQQDEEWTMIPNKSVSSIFNGADMGMLVHRTLRKGIYTETDKHGNTTVVEVLRKIR